MYRVELKDFYKSFIKFKLFFYNVPNVPCGVESPLAFLNEGGEGNELFLMYRVELKEPKPKPAKPQVRLEGS